jgi:dTDP-glucose pyrophosphorylase
MHAVVMAAGEGSRLRPLTERWPKSVLPIDGRPVLATLLRELAAAGCAHATVVTGHLAEQVEELVGDGSAFGLEIVFVRQPRAGGPAKQKGRGRDPESCPSPDLTPESKAPSWGVEGTPTTAENIFEMLPDGDN